MIPPSPSFSYKYVCVCAQMDVYTCICIYIKKHIHKENFKKVYIFLLINISVLAMLFPISQAKLDLPLG